MAIIRIEYHANSVVAKMTAKFIRNNRNPNVVPNQKLNLLMTNMPMIDPEPTNFINGISANGS